MFSGGIQRRLISDVTQHDCHDFVSLLRIFGKQTMHVMLCMDSLYARNSLPDSHNPKHLKHSSK